MPTAATGSELMFMSMPSRYITASDIGWATSDGNMTMSADYRDVGRVAQQEDGDQE